MTRLIRTLMLFVGLLAVALPVFAVGPPAFVKDGRMDFEGSTALYDMMLSQGMYYEVNEYSLGDKGTLKGFKIGSGTLDLKTGYGEIACAGSLRFVLGNMSMTVANMQMEITEQGAFLTAGVYLNSKYQGRQTIWTVADVPLTTLALGPVSSKSNAYMTFAPTFLNEFSSFFQLPQLLPLMRTPALFFVSYTSLMLVKPPYYV